ncbi:hypothetical protein HanRHA438_Chr01g0011261 [Helianthus annuus]|nr:hypothetical protein HanRHA438_Chr01g0011261 [Helianthus annuus]
MGEIGPKLCYGEDGQNYNSHPGEPGAHLPLPFLMFWCLCSFVC